MKIIGANRLGENKFVFYCFDGTFYRDMIVTNIFGALDLYVTLPKMTEEEFKQLKSSSNQ